MGLRSEVAKRWPALAPLVGKQREWVARKQSQAQLRAHDESLLSYEVNGRKLKADSTWYRGEHCNFLPDREAFDAPGALANYVGYGWLPHAPFITRSDPITTFGSCLAAHITKYLIDAGYSIADSGRNRGSYVIRCGEGMVNSAAIAQQFQWAYNEAGFNEPLWYDKDGREARYEESVRLDTLAVFERSKVFIITLGLSEVWYNRQTGETFWRAIPQAQYDPARHGFKVLSAAENKANLETAYQAIRRHRPEAAVIFTLSPVPLVATFRPVSCVTASSVSKASLRVAVDELMRDHADDDRLFYFPSYEIVKDVMIDPYQPDFRHIKPDVVALIMDFFAQHYLVDPPAPGTPAR
jgi:GSCFA family